MRSMVEGAVAAWIAGSRAFRRGPAMTIRGNHSPP